MFIVIRDDVFYVVEGVSKGVIEELREIIKSTGGENLKLYFTIYRTIMGIPLNVTPGTERSMLRERFGEPLFDSKEFTSNVILAQKDYEMKKAVLPDLIGWLVVEKGARVIAADEIFYV